MTTKIETKNNVVMCDSLIERLKNRIGDGLMFISDSELMESFQELLKTDSETLNENHNIRHIDFDTTLLEAIYNNIGNSTEEDN